MKIGIYQFNPIWGEKKRNIEKIKDNLSKKEDVDIWILPELCTTGYQIPSQEVLEDLAEPFPGGETANQFRKLSQKLKAGIIAGIAERDDSDIYNSSVIYEDGNYIGNYRKIHLYYRENKYFTPGGSSPPVFEVKGIKVGPMICFDWIFPETIRTLAIRGAQLIAHMANLVLPYCQDAMLTRSIENRVFTATANRIGCENKTGEELTFTGKSQITDIKGNRIKSLPEQKEAILTAEIEPEQAKNKDLNKYNNLINDRRSSLYES